MSNISDILLSIRALAPEDLRAFAETSKKCIEEDTRRRLDAIPPIPEEDEAREIPVTQTYPFIYISNEDLKKATYKMASNANGQPDSVQFTQEIDNPVVGNSVTDVSIVCYKYTTKSCNGVDKSYNSTFVQGNGVNIPPTTTQLEINNLIQDEKVVFILSKTYGYHENGNSYHVGNFAVITNFGNIYIGHRYNQRYNINYYREPSYPTAGPNIINSQPVKIVPSDIVIDDFCRVPQLFVDLMCFTLRSFGHSYATSSSGYYPPRISADEDFFKALCRKYNKDRRDMQTRIQTLETSLETLKEEMVRKNDLIEKQHIEEIDTDRINTFESLKEEHVIQIDNLKEEHAIKIRKLKAEHIAKINNLNDKNYSFLVFTCILSLFAIFVQYCVNRYVYF